MFDDVELSSMSPCLECKDVPTICTGSFSYEPNPELAENFCTHCSKVTEWHLKCIAKLKEYEKHSISTKDYKQKDKKHGIGDKMSCPKCERIAEFDPYFGAFICRYCGWESERFNRKD